jgi:hypothetical protein
VEISVKACTLATVNNRIHRHAFGQELNRFFGGNSRKPQRTRHASGIIIAQDVWSLKVLQNGRRNGYGKIRRNQFASNIDGPGIRSKHSLLKLRESRPNGRDNSRSCDHDLTHGEIPFLRTASGCHVYRMAFQFRNAP